MHRFGRWLRLHLVRALRENASPGRLALGLGLGAFVGIVPSFMIGAPLVFVLAGKLGLNRAAAVTGALVSMNPITAPFLYPLSAWLGAAMLRPETATPEVHGILNYLREYTVPFLVGNTVVAVTIAGLLAGGMFLWASRKGQVGLRAMLRPTRRSRPHPVQGSVAQAK